MIDKWVREKTNEWKNIMIKIIISWITQAVWLVLTYDLLKDRCIDGVTTWNFFPSLLCITNRFQVAVGQFRNRSQKNYQYVVRTSVTHSAAPDVPLFVLEQMHSNVESNC